jgi:hypothetical protein
MLAQAAEQDAAKAELEGARSQSVFNSSLSFLGKDYAPLENSLSARGPSPDTAPDTGEQHPSTTDPQCTPCFPTSCRGPSRHECIICLHSRQQCAG